MGNPPLYTAIMLEQRDPQQQKARRAFRLNIPNPSLAGRVRRPIAAYTKSRGSDRRLEIGPGRVAAAAGRPTRPVLSQCAHASRSFASGVPAVSCRDVNLSVDDAHEAAKKGKRRAPGRRV